MKTLFITLSMIVGLSQAQAGGSDIGSADLNAAKASVKTIILKQAVDLRAEGSSYVSSAEACVNMTTGQLEDKSTNECLYSNTQIRACLVFVYNTNKDLGEMHLPAGTQFRISQKIGPETHKDWSKKTNSIKLFAEIADSGLKDPRVIIECTQTKSGFVGPKEFSLKELKQRLSSILLLK